MTAVSTVCAAVSTALAIVFPHPFKVSRKSRISKSRAVTVLLAAFPLLPVMKNETGPWLVKDMRTPQCTIRRRTYTVGSTAEKFVSIVMP